MPTIHSPRPEPAPAPSLLLITDRFPYGTGETFLEPELEFLSRTVSHVYIFPQRPGGSSRAVPANVTMVDVFPSIESTRWRVLAALRGLVSGWAWRELARARHIPTLARIREVLSYAGFSAFFARRLQRFLVAHPEARTVYSYWCDRGALGVARLARKSAPIHETAPPPARLVARAHRWDLEDESSPTGRVPFRSLIVSRLDQVAAVSDHGHSYLLCRGAPQNKVSVHRLGVYGPTRRDVPSCDGQTLHLYSCSRAIPLKRLHVIAKALCLASAHAPEPRFEWTHLGDGPELGHVRHLLSSANPGRVRWDLRGHVSNRNVLNILDSEHFDLFLNVSDIEGIPVAAMEAASRGLAIAATDVGGNSEVVSERRLLLRKGIDEHDLASLLLTLSRDRGFLTQAGRRSQELWRSRFCADDTYARFAEEVLFGRGHASNTVE
jgi:colanic acid/amylovoran biosynthesis glycosyltransferase